MCACVPSSPKRKPLRWCGGMGLPREPRALPASCPLSQLEDEPCTVKGCYKLQPSRAAIYATYEGCGALAAGGIAVTCVFEGEVVETVLSLELEHMKGNDPIMYEECLLPAIPIARFGDTWTMAAGGADTLEQDRRYHHCVLCPAARTLNATGQYRVTLYHCGRRA